MTKIVINPRGNYRLSIPVLYKLCEILGKPIYAFEHKWKTEAEFKDSRSYFPITKEEALRASKSGRFNIEFASSPDYAYPRLPQSEKRQWCVEFHISRYTLLDEDRTNVSLIQAIEETSEEERDDLKIVEIPDDVKWIIESTDYGEHIAEKHRTWS